MISRGDKMDFTIQKSVELGVTCITPSSPSAAASSCPPIGWRKREQWQSGDQRLRAVRPQYRAEVRMPMELDAWLAEETQELKLNLHPRAPYSINTLPIPGARRAPADRPGRGLSGDEIARTVQEDFKGDAAGAAGAAHRNRRPDGDYCTSVPLWRSGLTADPTDPPFAGEGQQAPPLVKGEAGEVITSNRATRRIFG